ncbi:unnamed protein product [Prunus armeniaca]|uniref:DUF4283 domain-containing protein n=1 Tax=Prunus armeniaca TaxID=36596 RepID=A0A6J5WYD8_PRUAR|nr:unnamed protein product [Prunus armeniaca]
MALEDFESSFERQLDLTDRERVGVVIGSAAVSDCFVGFPYSLVAKIVSQQEVHRDNFIKTFTSLWKGSDEVSIKEIAHNRFWVRFVCDRYRQRVLDMEPWTFRQSMILLAAVAEEDCIHTMMLTHGTFWLQIHGVPGFYITVAVANVIGSTVGEILRVDNRDGQDCVGHFIRVRVRLDVRLPLMRRTPITFPEVGEKIIEFRYEYLPEYCFAYGCLGHPTQDCVKKHEALRGKLNPKDLAIFTSAFEGLEGVINLWRKSIGSSARRLFSQQHGSSHTERKNGGEWSGGHSWRASHNDSKEAMDTTSPFKLRQRHEAFPSSPGEVNSVVKSTPSALDQRGTSTVVPVAGIPSVLMDPSWIVQASVGPFGGDTNEVIAQTSDPCNFMPIIEKTAHKVTGRGRGRPRRVAEPIESGIQGVSAPYLKRKHLANHLGVDGSEHEVNGALGKRRLCDNMPTIQAEETSLEGSPRSQLQMGKLHTRLGVGGVRVGLQVDLLSSSPGHIDVRVTVNTSETFRVTGFYGHPDQTQRHHSWELLWNLGRVGLGPWLCCGDFNEVMECNEKSGSRLRRDVQMEDFKQAITDCCLFQFEFIGYPFTWSNKRKDTAHVEARLDRGFGNLALLQHWGNFMSHHLVAFSSDHHPILIASDGPQGDNARGPRGRRRFQFEEAWTTKFDCDEVVRQSWQSAVSPLSNIANCASNLSRWCARKGGQVPKKVKDLRLRLASLQS